jgi:hypothetical protein
MGKVKERLLFRDFEGNKIVDVGGELKAIKKKESVFGDSPFLPTKKKEDKK